MNFFLTIARSKQSVNPTTISRSYHQQKEYTEEIIYGPGYHHRPDLNLETSPACSGPRAANPQLSAERG